MWHASAVPIPGRPDSRPSSGVACANRPDSRPSPGVPVVLSRVRQRAWRAPSIPIRSEKALLRQAGLGQPTHGRELAKASVRPGLWEVVQVVTAHALRITIVARQASRMPGLHHLSAPLITCNLDGWYVITPGRMQSDNCLFSEIWCAFTHMRSEGLWG